VYHERSKVPGCDECEAPKENPGEFLPEICKDCPHNEKIENPELYKLLHYYGLQNADCPVDRHELLDHEWAALGEVKAEWMKLETEWHERNRPG
jgi:hypothetical protein